MVALVGRPNVGKSTLFNRLTRSRNALVADEPGLTRDRQYGRARIAGQAFLVIDTGGLTEVREGIEPLIARQALQAVDESDLTLLLVDARAGLTAADEAIGERLRRQGKPVLVVANKAEGLAADLVTTEFYRLGLGQAHAISAAHGDGLSALLENIETRLPTGMEAPAAPEPSESGVRIAVVGRPNVGKSTLVNRMLGEERVLAFDQPGTTRDSIFIPFVRDGRPYVLIDTAGVRRRARVGEGIEKFSVLKTLQAIEAAHVVVLLVDAREGVTEQDAHLLGYVLDTGRALVIAANKWDGLTANQRARVKDELERRFAFVDFARIHLISALFGSGVGNLFGAVDAAWAAASRDLPTAAINQGLAEAIAAHPPPLVRGRRIKLRYAHQGGRNPPVIVVHGNQTKELPGSYLRYLERFFRERFDLQGTPLRLELRTGTNPYAGKKNLLTPRQQHKRKRLLRHVKKR